jgi:hypothetical protein
MSRPPLVVPPFVYTCAYGYFCDDVLITTDMVQRICQIELSTLAKLLTMESLHKYLGIRGNLTLAQGAAYMKIVRYRLETGT